MKSSATNWTAMLLFLSLRRVFFASGFGAYRQLAQKHQRLRIRRPTIKAQQSQHAHRAVRMHSLDVQPRPRDIEMRSTCRVPAIKCGCATHPTTLPQPKPTQLIAQQHKTPRPLTSVGLRMQLDEAPARRRSGGVRRRLRRVGGRSGRIAGRRMGRVVWGSLGLVGVRQGDGLARRVAGRGVVERDGLARGKLLLLLLLLRLGWGVAGRLRRLGRRRG
eukprot:3059749-Rhodomonas_salina.5